MQVVKYQFQQLGDEKGQLVALEEFKDIPFNIKRVFFMYGTDAGGRCMIFLKMRYCYVWLQNCIMKMNTLGIIMNFWKLSRAKNEFLYERGKICRL